MSPVLPIERIAHLETAALRDFHSAYDQSGSRPVIRRCRPNVRIAPESARAPNNNGRPRSANTDLCVLVITRRGAHVLSNLAPDTHSGGIEHEENSFCCCSSYDGLGTSSRGAMSPSYADGHPRRPTCL